VCSSDLWRGKRSSGERSDEWPWPDCGGFGCGLGAEPCDRCCDSPEALDPEPAGSLRLGGGLLGLEAAGGVAWGLGGGGELDSGLGATRLGASGLDDSGLDLALLAVFLVVDLARGLGALVGLEPASSATTLVVLAIVSCFLIERRQESPGIEMDLPWSTLAGREAPVRSAETRLNHGDGDC